MTIMKMVMGERKHGRRISVHGSQFMNSRSFPKKRRINAQRLELQQKGLEKLKLAILMLCKLLQRAKLHPHVIPWYHTRQVHQ